MQGDKADRKGEDRAAKEETVVGGKEAATNGKGRRKGRKLG